MSIVTAPARNSIIDIARGIGLVLVVIGHSPWVTAYSESAAALLNGIRQTTFFLVGGVFLSMHKPLAQMAIHRYREIVQPFLVGCLLGVIYTVLREDYPFWGMVAGSLYGTGATVPWIPLWFLAHLFVASLTARVVGSWVPESLRQTSMVSAFFFFLLAVGVVLLPWTSTLQLPAHWFPSNMTSYDNLPRGLPWSLDLLVVTIPLMLLGWSLAPWIKSIRFVPWLFALVLVAYCALCLSTGDTFNMNERRIEQPVASFLKMAMGFYLALSLASGLQGFKRISGWLKHISTAGVFVLVFHAVPQGRSAWWIINHFDNTVILGSLFGTVLGLVVSLLIHRWVSRSNALSYLFFSRPARSVTT